MSYLLPYRITTLQLHCIITSKLPIFLIHNPLHMIITYNLFILMIYFLSHLFINSTWNYFPLFHHFIARASSISTTLSAKQIHISRPPHPAENEIGTSVIKIISIGAIGKYASA